MEENEALPEAKAQIYSHGQEPKNALLVAETVGWRLYYIPRMGNAKWRNYKLVSAQPLAGKVKANYWLGVCLADDMLANNHDLKAMKKNVPELLSVVAEQIKGHNATLRKE